MMQNQDVIAGVISFLQYSGFCHEKAKKYVQVLDWNDEGLYEHYIDLRSFVVTKNYGSTSDLHRVVHLTWALIHGFPTGNQTFVSDRTVLSLLKRLQTVSLQPFC